MKQKKVSNRRQRSDRVQWILALTVILAATFISLYPSVDAGFTNWDDPAYVRGNALITSLSGGHLRQIFTQPVSLNYHPLTILSLAIDYQWSGLNPGTYHVTNLILHLVNTLLVFVFIYLLSGRKIIVSFVASLLFGINPLHVESVAWISERKDVLYTVFYIGSLIAYLRYLDNGKAGNFVAASLLFVLSVLSKAVAVTIPVVFLLLDVHQRRKFTAKAWIEKIPLLLVSAAFGMAAVKIQSGGAVDEFGKLSVLQHASVAAYGFLTYIHKLFVPIHLSAFYPYPPEIVAGSMPFSFPIYTLGVFALCGVIWLAGRRNRILIFGFLFYLVSIALVLQFIAVGRVIIADRYTYIPSIGLFYILGSACDWLMKRSEPGISSLKYGCSILLLIYAAFCSFQTYQRTKVWQNSQSLWTDVIQKYPNCVLAYKNRGDYFGNEMSVIDKSYLVKALDDYNVLVRMDPKNAEVYSNLGNIYGLMGNYEQSIHAYDRSIELDGTRVVPLNNQALTYLKMGRLDESIESYTKALRLDPSSADAHENRAYAYLEAGEFAKAVRDYNFVLGKKADDADAYYYRGHAWSGLDNYEAGLSDMLRCIQLNPGNKEAYYNISLLYYKTGRYREAFEYAKRAKSLGLTLDDSYLKELEGSLSSQ